MPVSRPRTVEITVGTTSRPSDESDLHLLRLALELQVDALLLTIGAAARADTDHGNAADEVPWRRWAAEDLESARALARALLEHDVTPPAALSGGAGVGPDGVDGADGAVTDLVVRYTSMQGLLVNVLDRPCAGQAWRPVAEQARSRCGSRLEELRRHRGAT